MESTKKAPDVPGAKDTPITNAAPATDPSVASDATAKAPSGVASDATAEAPAGVEPDATTSGVASDATAEAPAGVEPGAPAEAPPEVPPSKADADEATFDEEEGQEGAVAATNAITLTEAPDVAAASDVADKEEAPSQKEEEDAGDDEAVASIRSDDFNTDDESSSPEEVPESDTIVIVPKALREAAERARRSPMDELLNKWTSHPFDPARYFSRKYDYYIYYEPGERYVPMQVREMHPARDYMAFPAGKEIYKDYPYTPSEYQPRRLHPYMFANPRIMRGFRPSKIITWLEKCDAETRIDIIRHVGKKTLYSYLDAKMRETLLYDLVIGLKEPIERVERDYTWSWWREYVRRNVGLAAVFAVFMLSATYIVKRVFSYVYDVPVPTNLGGPTPAQRVAAAQEAKGTIIDQLWAPIEWMGAQYMAQSNANPQGQANVVTDMYAGVGDDELDVDEADYAEVTDAPLTTGPVMGEPGTRRGNATGPAPRPGGVDRGTRPGGVDRGTPRPGGVDMGSDYGPTPAPLAGNATGPDWTPAGSNAVGGGPMIEGFVDGPGPNIGQGTGQYQNMGPDMGQGTGTAPGMGSLTAAIGIGGAPSSPIVPIRAIWFFYIAQLILSGLLLLYLYNATVRKESWTTFLPMDFSFANVWALYGLYQAVFFIFMVISLTDRVWGISGSTFYGYPVGMYPSMGARGVYKDVFYHWMIFSMYLVLSLSAILLLLPFLKVHREYSEKQKWLDIFSKGCRPVLKT